MALCALARYSSRTHTHSGGRQPLGLLCGLASLAAPMLRRGAVGPSLPRSLARFGRPRPRLFSLRLPSPLAAATLALPPPSLRAAQKTHHHILISLLLSECVSLCVREATEKRRRSKVHSFICSMLLFFGGQPMNDHHGVSAPRLPVATRN